MSSGPTISEENRGTLLAAMERILPRGNGPGATDANAIGYVDWITQQTCFQSASPCLCAGLSLLESLATVVWGKTFVNCSAEEQDALLSKLQDTPHPTVQRFFGMLVKMTLVGFLCLPAYGGNQDGVGWDYIGFRPTRLTLGLGYRRE